jgi:hypothetical protein
MDPSLGIHAGRELIDSNETMIDGNGMRIVREEGKWNGVY